MKDSVTNKFLVLCDNNTNNFLLDINLNNININSLCEILDYPNSLSVVILLVLLYINNDLY